MDLSVKSNPGVAVENKSVTGNCIVNSSDEEDESPQVDVPIHAPVNPVVHEDLVVPIHAPVDPVVHEDVVVPVDNVVQDVVVPPIDNVQLTPEDNARDGWFQSSLLPKVNSTVLFKSRETGDIHKASVISKGGKSVGRNKMYMNIHVDGEDEPKGVFWDAHVDVWKDLVEEENVVFIEGSELNSQRLKEAKQNELSNWTRNRVFEKVIDCGQQFVSSRWVFTEKPIPDSFETKLKARIVCRGYEEDSSNLRTDSPTCTKESLRLLITTISYKNWVCKSLDVRAAFLQGFPIDRELYLKPPADIEEKGYLWKLLKCPYGLNDAPRAWYCRVRSELEQLEISCSIYDEAFFHCRLEGKLIGLMVIHVDDIFYGGNSRFQSKIDKFASVFEIGVHNSVSFKYLGLELIQNKDNIILEQSKYIKTIDEIKITRTRSQEKECTLTDLERKEIKSKCGKLLWVSNNTRPDMAFEVSRLCSIGKSGTVSDILTLNKAIRLLKQDEVFIKFPKLCDPKTWSLCVFSDSSFANLPEGFSQGGYILFLKDRNGKVAPISWQSKKLQRVTKSTLSSETLAVIEGVDAAILIQRQLAEFTGLKPKIYVYTDSKSLYETVRTTKVITDKSQRVIISYLRQIVKLGEIKVEWVDGRDQVADSLTKFGASSNNLKDLLDRCHL